MSYTFDIVILDIMGVNGFDLLKLSVKTRILTPETGKNFQPITC
jgi:hypothetical protein